VIRRLPREPADATERLSRYSAGRAGDGGRAFGSNSCVPGGGAFLTHRVSPDLALCFAVAGNFGSMLDYDNTWGWGGNIDVDKRGTLPPVLGGRGNLVGSYDQTLSVVLTMYGNRVL
jgi:hypothetical protein